MQIDEKLLTKLEKLSYLKIDDAKREEMIQELSDIVSFVNNLEQLNTHNIDDTFAMNDSATFLREDSIACDRDINDAIIRNAPKSAENFFIVPKIIE